MEQRAEETRDRNSSDIHVKINITGESYCGSLLKNLDKLKNITTIQKTSTKDQKIDRVHSRGAMLRKKTEPGISHQQKADID